jgi:purine-nucleoside phosphorylase
MNQAVTQAVAAVRRHWTTKARAALILGTGLGSLTRYVCQEASIPFASIPGFPTTTALAHRGCLVCGRINGTPIMMLDGRCHLYEGYQLADITLPVRVLRACGAELLIISNASGGLNPRYRSGDVMVIADHISLLGKHGLALRLAPGNRLDQALHCSRSFYDPLLVDRALEIARQEDFPAHRGVYVAVTGPNYETRAEYRLLRRIGGDAVGMSTVPEARVAAQLGMRTLGLSVITNVACTDAPRMVNAFHVLDAAAAAEPRIRQIVLQILATPWSPRMPPVS